VVTPGEVEAGFGELAADDLELLREKLHSDGSLREGKPVRAVLALVPAAADAELDPSARDVVDGHCGAGEHRRVPEGDGRDERAQPQLGGNRGEAGERRPAVERAALALPVETEVVVGAEERLAPVVLARARQRDPLLPGHALLYLA